MKKSNLPLTFWTTKPVTVWLLPLFLIIGCGTPDPSNRQQQIVEAPVDVEEVRPTSIKKYIPVSGTLSAQQVQKATSLFADGHYFLKKNPRTGKPFAMGDAIKKGETIIELRSDRYIQELRIGRKKIELEMAQKLYEKQKGLLEKGGITLIDLQKAELSYNDAQYAYNLALQKKQDMFIRARFNGVLAALPFHSQNEKIKNNVELATIMEYSQMYMDFQLSESVLEKIAVGNTVFIIGYSTSHDTVKGVVSEISPIIDDKTGTQKARILVRNKNLGLIPGLFVQAEIQVATKRSVLSLPRTVIRRKGDIALVFVINENKAYPREVSLGIEGKQRVEITSGLEEEEQVVVRGYETLKTGSVVRIERVTSP